MKKLAFMLLALLFMIEGYCQTRDGNITMQKTFGGVKFYQDGRLLKPREVLTIMEPIPEAFNTFKKAKSNYDGANVLGFIGGAMIGWPLGTAVAGGDPEWGLAAGGTALVLASIPLTSGFKKHARTAVDLYNADDTTASLKPKVNMNFYGTGARVVIVF